MLRAALTDSQLEVLQAARRGEPIWHPRGAEYWAWVGDPDGECHRTVRRNAVQALVERGLLRERDDDPLNVTYELG